MLERYELSTGRIEEIINEENALESTVSAYFRDLAKFISMLSKVYFMQQNNELCKLGLQELKQLNNSLYEDILIDNYERSYGNPGYIVPLFESLGYEANTGRYLCFLYAQIRALIPYAFEKDIEILTIYFELFIEVYNMFAYAAEENEKLSQDALKNTLYWFERDNLEIFCYRKVNNMINGEGSFLTDYLMGSELDDERYLYLCGEYVTENIIAVSKHLNSFTEDEIEAMASTYTEGYRIGFVKAGKPLDKKSVVEIRYELGFERMVRAAVHQFEKMGLKPVILRDDQLALSRDKEFHFFHGAVPNRQYLYDHKDDKALMYDGEYIQRRLDLLKAAFEEKKDIASGYAGPAVIETFGEDPFAPLECREKFSLSKEQKTLSSEFMVRNATIVNKYIKGEERSFTIIAYPLPQIGPGFETIFTETVKLNTLDYKLYEDMQQILIDTMDEADKIHIVGKGGNRTDIFVNLYKLSNPDKETIFENCVADVNIPVGEVFTSPVLKGTEGVLHLPEIFLESLRYDNLELVFKDGIVADYNCSNFDNEDENKDYIKTNLLKNHDFLPIGEFAIGTNTTAYAMAKKYNISRKLPILIGEKTGPHFAIGDTCYSHEEEVKVYNPDGKEIVAKSNDYADLREKDPQKAYFSCHTDITIPYDELEYIRAVRSDNTEISIIEDGRFVLEGLDKLNEPLINH